MKDNNRIYTLEELDDLLKKDHTCIIVKHLNRKIELKAKYVKDLKAGIHEALDKGLNKFDYSLNGIMLDYRNLNILTDKWNGRIVGRCGEFIITIEAEFFVFDPKIGNLLEGVVNAKTTSHVGCLVHKRFNAMLLKSDTEENWKCKNIHIGEKVIFKIVDHVFSGRIPHIEGVYVSDFNKKSSGKKRKKSEVLLSQVEELKENGEIHNEQDKIIEGNKTYKMDKMDLYKLSFKEQEEQDSVSNLQKLKSKKKKHVSMPDASVDNLMDLDEPFSNEKKKKKHKEKKNKSDNILETERTFESINMSSTPKEAPASVFSAEVTTLKDDESLQVKSKKKERKRNVEHLDESKIRSKNDEDLQSTESTSHKKKKKKHDKEKYLQTVESPVQKSKKRKKLDEENSTRQIVETELQSEISQSERNVFPSDDRTEVNINPVHFIDELMNIVPSDVILRSETTPVKRTNLESLSSPKRIKLSGDKKTPKKSSSPSKKKLEESGTKNTLQNTRVDGLEYSPSKKNLLEQSVITSESNNPQEESLFSDEEANIASPFRSPKTLPKPHVLDASSSLGKREIPNDGADSDKVLLSSTSTKETKRKKTKVQSDKKKLKNESYSLKGFSETDGSILKSPVDIQDKKDSDTEKSILGNKRVARTSDNITSPVEKQKTTLLERFETCIMKGAAKSITPSNKTAEKMVETTEGSFKAKMKKTKVAKLKMSGSKEEENKSTDNFGYNAQKISFSSGVDSIQLYNPVTTSTPKPDTKSEDLTGKSGEGNKTKTTEDEYDGERSSIIECLLQQTIEKLGLASSPGGLSTHKKGVVQSTLSKWLMGSKGTKAKKKKTTKDTDNADKLEFTDPGCNSTDDNQEL